MNDDFCIFILTNGRPDRVPTYRTFRNAGFTGKIYIVIDDEDKTASGYIDRFGSDVLVFSKEEISKTFDEGDNFNDRRAIIYARNATFQLAEQVGCKYFMQLDDDYTRFSHRFDKQGFYCDKGIKDADAVIDALLRYYKSAPFMSIAVGQGGDFIGGEHGGEAKSIHTKRKAMNTFICSTDRPFKFSGRINEDVNTYTALQRRGPLFLTLLGLSITQLTTQGKSGGMTEMYLETGTYMKSFYSIMYCPSSVKITIMGDTKKRIHHEVNWNTTAPKILHEKHRKSRELAQ